jgi:PAS domain S-box-containing protein
MSTIKRGQILPINESRQFDIEEVFFSTTDSKGRITAGNDVFVRISGYSYDELIGKAHNIIRHPDMPRCVFKLLWEYIQAGRPIAAFVKNMAKDGKYYWVVALVEPIEGGYLSVRFKPSSPLLEIVNALYAELLALEQNIEESEGGSNEKGMIASRELLLEKLASLKFANYDQFMRVAMLTEIRSRNKALKASAGSFSREARRYTGDPSSSSLARSCAAMGAAVDELFEQMDAVTAVESVVGSFEKFIADFASTMRNLSLNAAIESNKLGTSARAIAVVAQWLNTSSVAARDDTSTLSQMFMKVIGDVRTALFELACAKLQVDVMRHYVQSLGDLKDGDGGPSRHETLALVRLLCKTMSQTMSRALEMLGVLPKTSAELLQGLELIDKQERTLRFLHVAGLVEIARLSEQSSLRSVFDQVADLIDRTNEELHALQSAVGGIQRAVHVSATPQKAVAKAVNEVSQLSSVLA